MIASYYVIQFVFNQCRGNPLWLPFSCGCILSGQAQGPAPTTGYCRIHWAGYIGPDFPEVQIVLHIPQISRIYHSAGNHARKSIILFYFGYTQIIFERVLIHPARLSFQINQFLQYFITAGDNSGVGLKCSLSSYHPDKLFSEINI